LALAGLLALLLWVSLDLFGPRSADLRRFNAEEVARLDTAMWRSYYDQRSVRLFQQLAELLRGEYHLPYLRSHWVAFQAARAAFIFKKGRQRKDYEKALPYLQNYYSAIRKVSQESFDVDRAARLELEWWIVHRERAKHSPEDLPRLLAELAAELYHLPAERFIEHGRLRADAMHIRDSRAESGGVSEADWAQIERLLQDSWHSLWKAVNL
jgi:hypothetical protein